MPGKQFEGAGASDLIAEMRDILDETQRTIEASQTILDRCAPDLPGADGTPGTDLLGEIADSLIHAYRLAREEGDSGTIALVEQAMLQVGRRLARGMSPEDAGLVCH